MEAILPGAEVEARGQRWHVVLTQLLGPQTLFRLRSTEGADRGAEIDFLHPLEEIHGTRNDFDPERPAPLPNWLTYHQAFLLEQAPGRNALVSVQPGRLEIQPYQLVPVLRAIRMSRVRLLLADGVGLGKTIQAGLILTELIARRIAHRILIVSPAGPLMDQRQIDLLERFGLRLEVVDRARLEEIRKETELGSNPFDHIPLGLVPLDFLKQEQVLDLLERTDYDVIVIDEAHHCMDVGSIQDREGSQRRRLAEVLARQCDNSFIEAFNARFRQECRNEHWFLSMEDAKERMEAWRIDYNEVRPHGSQGNHGPSDFTRLKVRFQAPLRPGFFRARGRRLGGGPLAGQLLRRKNETVDLC